MSRSADIQAAIASALGAADVLPVAVPIVSRRTKDLAAEVAAATANWGLCVFVMPPLPTSADPDLPFVFFDHSLIRVCMIEKKAVNRTGSGAFEFVASAAQALHWTNPGDFFAGPMHLLRNGVEKLAEHPEWRVVDLKFDGPWQGGGPRTGPLFTPDSNASITADLHAATLGQLRAVLAGWAADIAIVSGQPRDLEGRLALSVAQQSGLWLEIDPAIPTTFMDDYSAAVFIEAAQIVVHIHEIPALNRTGYDAYDLIHEVAESLHYQDFGGWLEQPMRIDANPVRETVDLAAPSRDIAVAFNATFGLGETVLGDEFGNPIVDEDGNFVSAL